MGIYEGCPVSVCPHRTSGKSSTHHTHEPDTLHCTTEQLDLSRVILSLSSGPGAHLSTSRTHARVSPLCDRRPLRLLGAFCQQGRTLC